MNPNYTEFKFPKITAHPWSKVFSKRMPPDAVDLVSLFSVPAVHASLVALFLLTNLLRMLHCLLYILPYLLHKLLHLLYMLTLYSRCVRTCPVCHHTCCASVTAAYGSLLPHTVLYCCIRFFTAVYGFPLSRLGLLDPVALPVQLLLCPKCCVCFCHKPSKSCNGC